MVAACPSCKARYRVDVARLPTEGARLRCSRCETVFRVRWPAGVPRPVSAQQVASPQPVPAPVAPPQPVPAPVAPPQPVPAPVAPPRPTPVPVAPPRLVHVEPAAPAPQPGASTPPELALPPPESERERLVLVAHSEVEEGKRLADALVSWGLEVLLVHDGVEAILGIQRSLPRAVVVDAALPKMFGFQVCELLKRNESLREIKVVLLGAIHDRERFRPPHEAYGADAYLERHELPDALAPLLRDFGLAGSATPAPPPQSARPQQPVMAGDPSLAPEIDKAERLARIIVSDIMLYNGEKFEAGVAQGNVLERMADELREGCQLLAQRVDSRIEDTDSILRDEMLRVARERGMA